MGDADSGHAVGFVVNFNVVEDVGAFLLEDVADFHRQQADFGIGVRAAAQFEEVSPGAAIARDKDFGFGGVRKD